MRSFKVFVLAFVASATALPLAFAAEGDAIKKAMKEGMKKGGLCGKVASGKASADEQKQLLTLFTDMAKDTPPKGDKASWAKHAGALVQASQEIVDGKESGIANLKKAANCKACHSVHKAD